MSKLTLDLSNVKEFINSNDLDLYSEKALCAKEKLLNGTGKGNDFIEWVKWPITISDSEISKIKECAKRLQSLGDYLVVIGIGGSYLGAKAGLEMLKDYFDKGDKKVIFSGNSFSSTHTKQLLDFLKDKDFSVLVISKSGTTTESAMSFRLIKELMDKKFNNVSERIVAITTNHDSLLHSMALEKGYEEFYIPDGIGGRYSVLTAVGLLPLAFSNIDISEIIEGSKHAYEKLSTSPFENNEALQYASIRNILYNQGKDIEILAFYEPNMRYFGEWWKQLYGESEGKENKGIFPTSVIYSTDLHSLGQYVQDGKRNLFETVVNIINPKEDVIINSDEENLDNLNYLALKKLNYVNSQAMKGTISAHVEGGVPNIILNIEALNEYTFGYLTYFFMFACGVSGYLLDVNPFNQEGVEAYKKKMFALLGKPVK